MLKPPSSKPKVLIIQGSPRKKGNSASLAARAAEGAISNGAEVESVYLHGLKLKPCQGCERCQEESYSGCTIDDEMNGLFPKLKNAGAIIIASPVYWFNFSAQTKTFIDRLYAVGVGTKNIFKGKKLAVILTFADPDPFISGAVNALRSFQDMCQYLDADIGGIVYGRANGPGEILENKDAMEQAYSLGRNLTL
jgi:multimeric flavodoxin WrbA